MKKVTCFVAFFALTLNFSSAQFIPAPVTVRADAVRDPLEYLYTSESAIAGSEKLLQVQLQIAYRNQNGLFHGGTGSDAFTASQNSGFFISQVLFAPTRNFETGVMLSFGKETIDTGPDLVDILRWLTFKYKDDWFGSNFAFRLGLSPQRKANEKVNIASIDLALLNFHQWSSRFSTDIVLGYRIRNIVEDRPSYVTFLDADCVGCYSPPSTQMIDPGNEFRYSLRSNFHIFSREKSFAMAGLDGYFAAETDVRTLYSYPPYSIGLFDASAIPYPGSVENLQPAYVISAVFGVTFDDPGAALRIIGKLPLLGRNDFSGPTLIGSLRFK